MWVGFGRAIGGALLFSMPLLMTMELWRIAVAADVTQLAALALATLLLTLGLAHTFGAMSGSITWRDATVDAGVAILAGTLTAGVILSVLEVINPVGSWTAALSIVAVEALPASIGAAYARSQLGQSRPTRQPSSYGHELFLMAAGAVVFASNVAPTEEVVLLSALMDESHVVLLVLLSLLVMHAFVYALGFSGQEQTSGFKRDFLVFTIPGYLIAFTLSAFLLWAFGRYDDVGLAAALSEAVVLALPASVGAAAARLIL